MNGRTILRKLILCGLLVVASGVIGSCGPTRSTDLAATEEVKVLPVPEGKEVFTLSLDPGKPVDPLCLRSGSLVDVVVTLKPPPGVTGAESMTLTMLSGIQVLSASGRKVNLLITPEQARGLDEIAQNGKFSLVLHHAVDGKRRIIKSN